MEYCEMEEQEQRASIERQIKYLLNNLDITKLRRVVWYIMKIMV